jgi:carboxylesterase type B
MLSRPVLLGLLPVFAKAATSTNSTSVTTSTSLTFLYQNNLNFTDDVNHIGAILLDPMSSDDGQSYCQTLSESLLMREAIEAHSEDFTSLLRYDGYLKNETTNYAYQIANGTVELGQNDTLQFYPGSNDTAQLPVLCTQTDMQNRPNATATSSNQISTTDSKGNTYLGFRNQKSFRFQGIPYASQPERFQYSTLLSASGTTINATTYGKQCVQPYVATNLTSEDCLFLNIQTPYLPMQNSRTDLRPVHFWIHGGGFTGGTGSDAGSDGCQLSSREDIVVVSINYRLSTLGFLAIPGTNITGNYGIGDQIVALEWVKENIAAFGGDPNKVTIVGESAGAGSVRTLLGSPKAIGLYRASIAMSNLGGGVALGLTGDYATTYSSYLTVNASYQVAGQQIFTGVGCNQTGLADQVQCLTSANATTIVNLPTVARYVVQDGQIVNTPNLDVYNKNGSAANVHTIWGNTANDGASFSTYPTSPVANLSEGLQIGLSINASYAQSIIDSGLFPYYDTGNLTADSFNVTQRVATDLQFRCVDQATVYAGVQSGAFKKSYYYQMDRTYSGYNPNNVDGNGPVQEGFPYGNPNEPYYRLHGSDMPWMFVSLEPNVLDNNTELKRVSLVK